MIGAVIGVVIWLGGIVAFFWSLDALMTLKHGQREIIKRLKNLEVAAGVPEHERFAP